MIGAASGVSARFATLNGIADPNGAAASAYFEYGVTTAYGSVTPASVGEGGAENALPPTTVRVECLSYDCAGSGRLHVSVGPSSLRSAVSRPRHNPGLTGWGETLVADRNAVLSLTATASNGYSGRFPRLCDLSKEATAE
jgi:hypothetical protein